MAKLLEVKIPGSEFPESINPLTITRVMRRVDNGDVTMIEIAGSIELGVEGKYEAIVDQVNSALGVSR